MSYLLQQDGINGKAGKAFCTIDGKNIALFNLKNLRTEEEYTTTEFPVVGTKTIQTGITGVKHNGKMTVYYGTSAFAKIAETFNRTGKMPRISILASNDDEATTVGKQTIAYYDVVLTKIPLTILDDSANYLEEEIPFSYGTFEILESFADPNRLGGA